MQTRLPPSPIPTLRTVEIGHDDEPLLQGFFDANPEYFLGVHGEVAPPTEAHEEIHGELPVGWSFTKKWLIGYLDGNGRLTAVAHVVTDLLAGGVWHLGLFIVETARHGNGEARLLYDGLERWARSSGANWIRLGVVLGSARAERFWESLGFLQTRSRHGVQMGQRTNVVRVMVKPLAGLSVDEYLAIVPRDRPD